MHLWNSFFILGVVGLLGSTFGTSVLAWCVVWFSRSELSSKTQSRVRLSLDILVPVHNEAEFISKTLSSIADAKDKLSSEKLEINLIVGLDRTSDQSEKRIQHFIYHENTDVKIVENRGPAGKWNMINQLVRESKADWVALVDAGSLWDAFLLREAVPYFYKKNSLGVAPSYQVMKANLFERLHWGFERILKTIESSAGGPVSVHGATVFYERNALLTTLDHLKGVHWLNDDVVIPLNLRILFPKKRLVYLAKNTNGDAWVTDIGVKHSGLFSDLRRRRRMIFGNVQWIHAFLGKAFQSSFSIGMLAMRRVFRIFWAYAALFLIVGTVFKGIHSFPDIQTYTLCLLSLVLSAFLYKMRSAFWAGLEIPFQFFNHQASTPSEKTWN